MKWTLVVALILLAGCSTLSEIGRALLPPFGAGAGAVVGGPVAAAGGAGVGMAASEMLGDDAPTTTIHVGEGGVVNTGSADPSLLDRAQDWAAIGVVALAAWLLVRYLNAQRKQRKVRKIIGPPEEWNLSDWKPIKEWFHSQRKEEGDARSTQ